jgi:hypothetical protein
MPKEVVRIVIPKNTSLFRRERPGKIPTWDLILPV